MKIKKRIKHVPNGIDQLTMRRAVGTWLRIHGPEDVRFSFHRAFTQCSDCRGLQELRLWNYCSSMLRQRNK